MSLAFTWQREMYLIASAIAPIYVRVMVNCLAVDLSSFFLEFTFASWQPLCQDEGVLVPKIGLTACQPNACSGLSSTPKGVLGPPVEP